MLTESTMTIRQVLKLAKCAPVRGYPVVTNGEAGLFPVGFVDRDELIHALGRSCPATY